MAKIIILGDLFPKNIISFPAIPNNDFCVANLECSITNSETGIVKDGPNLKISPKEIDIIKRLGVNIVGLANNHSMDYGVNGLKDTIAFLDSFGIKHSGNTFDGNYHISEIAGKNVCFYFISEHQYNYSENDLAGVNVLDLYKSFNEVASLKAKCDFLIVLYHGGKEYYEYPTPFQQSVCHKFVNNGANLVVCQHSHCVGCTESYNGATIVYGQGNFMFPYRENNYFKTGLIIELTFDCFGKTSLSFVPIVHKENGVVRYATSKESDTVLGNFEKRSIQLTKNTTGELYEKMIYKDGFDFLYKLFNKSKMYILLDTSRLFKNRLLKRYIRKNKKYITYLYNYFNCETHSEYIKAILSRQIKETD